MIMENINVKINKATRQVTLPKSVIGNDGENLQEKLVFYFEDQFVDGTARIEIHKTNSVSTYIMLTKVNETYELPIKSIITTNGKIDMQLVITEGTNEEEIPIFKSNTFYVVVNSSINAEIEQPDEYAEWIDIANEKLNELDAAIGEAGNLNISASKSGSTTTVTLTDKDGQTSEVSITDGQNGEDGISPIATVTQNRGGSATITITDASGTTSATIHDGEPGENGQDGQDGITPTIGDNGNWYLGSLDTGKPSRGIQGETGQTGATGQNGRDGYVQYTAGNNITIENNVISASGGETIEWLPSNANNPFLLSTMEKGIYYPLGIGWYKDTSLSTAYNYLYTENNGNYCFPYVLILNKDVSKAQANEEFGYAVFIILQDKNVSGKLLKSGDLWIAPIKKVNTTIRIVNYSYGVWNLIGQFLNEVAQSIKGIKTFYNLPTLSSYTAPTEDAQLVAKKYVDDSIASAITNTLNGSY